MNIKAILTPLKIALLHLAIGPFIGLNAVIIVWGIQTAYTTSADPFSMPVLTDPKQYIVSVAFAYIIGGGFAFITGLVLGIISHIYAKYSYLMAALVSAAIALIIPLSGTDLPIINEVRNLEMVVALFLLPSITAALFVKFVINLWAKRQRSRAAPTPQ